MKIFISWIQTLIHERNEYQHLIEIQPKFYAGFTHESQLLFPSAQSITTSFCPCSDKQPAYLDSGTGLAAADVILREHAQLVGEPGPQVGQGGASPALHRPLKPGAWK